MKESEYIPKEFDHDLVKACCCKFLWNSLHERHLEDCIQFCCLQWFEGRTNIQWSVIEYCRQNGIGDRGKQSAKTLEFATLVGLDSDENETTKEMGFLFDQKAIDKFQEDKEQEVRLNFIGRLEEFLLPINLKKETLLWVLKRYRPTSKTNAKIFNTLPTHST